MDQYQLAKLVQWAGKLRTRKRMQKVVYLLQAAGCPFGATFTIHHFGPYSADVAQTTDVMVQLDLLEEHACGNAAGRQFDYVLSDDAKASLATFEKTDAGRKAEKRLSPFRKQAVSLLGEDVRRLEIAATLVYFRNQTKNWDAAIEKTCQFKKLRPTDSIVASAEELAREILDE